MDKVRKLISPTWRSFQLATRKFCCDNRMSSLVSFPEVAVGDGKLKYILAKVYIHGEMGHAKTVVRTLGRVKYHLNIYDQLQKEAAAKNLCTQCLGGGTLVHDPEKHYIKIFGQSQTLGRANHDETKSILNDKYPDYKIDAESSDTD
ncbi:hypothetical protein ACLKA7_002126 [Drosophila subpalustris]